MKKRFILLISCLFLALCGCSEAAPETTPEPSVSANHIHADADSNGVCDTCLTLTTVIVDFYTVNDLHGKIADAATHPGVDEMTTYLRNANQTDDHVVLLSAGDMWQGSAESNTTQGHITTDWMNDLGFVAMAVGNHEFDWGEAPVESNDQMAQFPFLAINIYDRQTKQQVEYCESSVMIERGGIQIGIIGAIGNCYSSIAPDKVEDIYFLTGDDLTRLVKEESTKLRESGADFIVYVMHEGYDNSTGASVKEIESRELNQYYDVELSNGYVDLVFEGHTHQRYVLEDEYGVYHLQNGGDNKGISHVEIEVDLISGQSQVRQADLVTASTYAHLEDDPIVQNLLDQYADVLQDTMRVVGSNKQQRPNKEMRQLVADLYYQVGVERWGAEYDIALGGGFISIRDPGYLAKGEVTYAMLQALFPFDNELVLCSIKGRDLLERFYETDHYAYFISYGDYGRQVYANLDPEGTYYVIVDTYSSGYAPNNLTEIDRYDAKVYARDLLAEYIQSGAME